MRSRSFLCIVAGKSESTDTHKKGYKKAHSGMGIHAFPSYLCHPTIPNKKHTFMYIETINSPADVKGLSTEELTLLAGEIRQALLQKLSARGGHFGPNFGMVEATLALHYVFDSPRDKIVFDVSHQSYVHKMLTGRKDAFLHPEAYADVSGYSEPSESEHDFFVIGHTSTSVSLAGGLAKARDLRGESGNVIAVIGDGSLSGGEALEGLDYAAELGTNLILVVNDNQMSIAENHGGLYANLQALRESRGTCACNLFRAMGLDYRYVEQGNDVSALIHAFAAVKDTTRPVVVHINTQKGKGYGPAEQNREAWHYCAPFDIATGLPSKPDDGPDYATLTADYLLERMAADSRVVAITAGTPTVMGFDAGRRQKAGSQFVDVGIAEEHAVALASGIAAGGGRPVFGVYSTFIQRAYDQLSQDLCINRNPAVLLVFWGSLSSMNDVTHLCFFDIPLMSHIPNLVYLAPTDRSEYMAMLSWSLRQTEHPVAIRVPMGPLRDNGEARAETDYGQLNRYQVVRRGTAVALIAAGSFFDLGRAVADRLKAEDGLDVTLVNPRYLTGLDEDLLDSLRADHRLVVTLEDGVAEGGFGETIAHYYGPTSMRVLVRGARKAFVDRFDRAELLRANRLTEEQIVTDIRAALR